jgi:NADPH:quinone reductase-like Zn-dependent oxidoreductase
MKAIVYDKYGSPDVLELREIERPVVTDDGVLVRVHATSVNPVDWHTMTGTPYLVRMQAGLTKPKREVLGVDFAGTVKAVGRNVKQFQPGDEVFGAKSGAFAEYVCVREERAVVLKPAKLTFGQAAAVGVAALTAVQGLRDKGPDSVRAKSPHQRRVRGRGHVCRADCEVVRSGSNRRMQHAECGHRPIDWRRPRHRLHPRGLHVE